jgi:UDP:flavonoid glycosyltransferase YjiC (YdhE family)
MCRRSDWACFRTARRSAGCRIACVATTGGKTAAELRISVPANARVEPFIPFARLIPYLSALVTNGGDGGVTIALAHGVPVIAGGTTEDKPEVANRIATAGVGINLKTATPTPEQVKVAVRRILDEPAFRASAKRLQQELAMYDGPARAAELLETLARTKQSIRATLTDAMGAARWRQRPNLTEKDTVLPASALSH